MLILFLCLFLLIFILSEWAREREKSYLNWPHFQAEMECGVYGDSNEHMSFGLLSSILSIFPSNKEKCTQRKYFVFTI
jgi:hypothetical protein